MALAEDRRSGNWILTEDLWPSFLTHRGARRATPSTNPLLVDSKGSGLRLARDPLRK